MFEVRELRESDLEQVKRIHEKFYKQEFSLPDFFNKFICAFCVVSDDRIIVAGGVRGIAEVLLVTDRNAYLKERVRALKMAFDASKYIAQQSGFNQLHSFVQNGDWEKHLKSYGWDDCKGRALVFPKD